MYIYVYISNIYTHTYTYMYPCIYVYIHTYIHTHKQLRDLHISIFQSLVSQNATLSITAIS